MSNKNPTAQDLKPAVYAAEFAAALIDRYRRPIELARQVAADHAAEYQVRGLTPRAAASAWERKKKP